MLFMIIERFRNGDAVPVYRRFRDHGRMAPDTVNYVGSWVTPDLTTCFQVMDALDREALEEWITHWRDLVDFNVIPVISSADAQTTIAPRL